MICRVQRRILLAFAAAGLLSIAVLAWSCGGDGNNSGSDGGGNDESYAAAICKAELNFRNELEKLSDESDDTEIAKTLVSALDNLTAAFERARPPSDGKPFHDQIVQFFKDARKQINEKGPDALADVEPPTPPADVSARLEKIAQTNKDCQEANFSFLE